jgi:hypothetical protein
LKNLIPAKIRMRGLFNDNMGVYFWTRISLGTSTRRAGRNQSCHPLAPPGFPLKLSKNPFSIGHPGWMKSSRTPF